MTAEFLTADPLSGLPHGFFTRRGGVSAGGFATLNCSLSGQDDPERVAINRARAMEALGLPPESLSGVHQVHGIAVAEVTAPIPNGARPQADALVTRQPGLALGVVTADCGPVLFADRKAGVVGAAHSGWRGAVAGMLEATLDAMERLGAHRADIAAVVGPCIRQDSYEVGADLRDAVLAQNAEAERFLIAARRPGHWLFDLPGYCAARLVAAGAGMVGVIATDTFADAERFFSHRRRTLNGEGPIGHQLSAIALPR
ncbi:peptidoglycan editing factor PgeF [Teichococcus oryzae]|uniref:Purine nucleoside phosphorylase n=1 Tax=Teichococcus oryzae TaxID=1608942 RepID=A0A5B2TKS7_9PROT|nr:peptidoglycan editing factor PgeF [Pseudoroseomonas oryzae]KAA2214793.1 peptidoglycan editing factor PgeF [Pseudoroseomonas oryzae]